MRCCPVTELRPVLPEVMSSVPKPHHTTAQILLSYSSVFISNKWEKNGISPGLGLVSVWGCSHYAFSLSLS